MRRGGYFLQGLSRPVLETGNWSSKQMAKSWIFSPSLPRLKEQTYSRLYSIPPEVQELIQKLARLSHVQGVRAIAAKHGNFNEIEFEVKVAPENVLMTEFLDKVQDLAIESEWNLRDRTGKSWYFDVQLVNTFKKVKDGTEVGAASYSQRPEVLRNFSYRYLTAQKPKLSSSVLS